MAIAIEAFTKSEVYLAGKPARIQELNYFFIFSSFMKRLYTNFGLVKFADYHQITRSPTFLKSINSLEIIVMKLLDIIELEDKSVRLLGIAIKL